VPSRISALALVVPDYDQAIAFYVGKLGFRLTEDIDQGRKRWVTVEPPGGGARLVLARAEGPAQRKTIGNQAGGRVFLFLQTDDFARDHAAMLTAGVIFEEAPRHEPYGTVAVWRDPFGNRWDLIGPSPAGKGSPPPPSPEGPPPAAG
jgi:catechol 2,3-dioxygenase-like lactoylglutathione lyase family enzyme